MPQICDMGPTALLPLRRKASAGFEPANLGTKGQHATPRPPKPLCVYICKGSVEPKAIEKVSYHGKFLL